MKLNNILTRNIKKYWHLYLFGIIAVVLVDVLQLYIPQITGEITDGLKSGTMDEQELVVRVLQMLGIGLIITAGRFIWRYFVFGTSRYVEREMRNEFFGKMLRLSQGFFNKNKTGDMMALATNDLGSVRMMAGPGIVMFIDTTLFTVLVLYKMVTYVDVRLTLVAIIPMPLIAVSSLFLGKAIRRRFKDKQEAFAKMTEIVQENISGIRVIKAFVQESQEMAAFDRVNRNNYDQNMRVVRLQSLSQPIANFVVGLCIILVLVYGGAMVMGGWMTVGNLVAFIQYLFMLIWPMIALGMGINIMSQGMASLQRIEDVLAQPEEVHDGDCDASIAVLRGGIKIRDLDFGYNEGTPVLHGIDLDIEPGQSVGIIGRTGSGKTTLINVLTRLYNPPKGRILLDGHELYEVPLGVLRTQIVGVPQDNFLFSETIEANIAFGDLEVERQSVEAAARAAAVHDNIVDFPQGYETVVGEKGVTLSGGQKQRVSIARALLLQPPVLILDDSLSAVDTNTEAEILDNLRAQRTGKTTVIIAHRISAIAHCDQILVMDGGKIAERGSHESLLQRQGLYSNLYNKQQLEKELEAMA